MELILWRHAESDPSGANLAKRLSPKGLKQAAWTASWLEQRLPSKFAVFSSPAESARQTAAALGVEARVCERLGPSASVSDVLEVVDWPHRKGTVSVVVSHQPTLGRVAAYLLADTEAEFSIRKGGLWWISRRETEGKSLVVVRAVTSPEFL